MGQVFTIDVMFAMFLITLLIGLSANAMDNAGYKILEYSSEQSLQRIAGDTADVLIKTPGSPENWEEGNPSTLATPGLAEIDYRTKMIVGNTLSMKKIFYLKDNPNLLKKILPSGMDYSLMIYPTNTSLPIIEVQNKNPPKGVKDVSVINRTVLCDYMIIEIYSKIIPDTYFVNDESEYVCTHSHMDFYKHQYPDFKNKRSGWLCNAFNMNLEEIKSNDFYILTDPPFNTNSNFNSKWIIDTPDNTTFNAQNFTSNPIMINSRILELLGNKTSEIFVFHVFTSGDIENTFNTYLIGVPKGTPPNDIRIYNMKPQPAFLILKLWME
jgi:hypothetical protein